MQNNSQKLGKDGEMAAREYLVESGYTILESNWRYKKLEVDIIASRGNAIVFVEVKTRRTTVFGNPEMFVNRRKQEFMVAAAQHYLSENGVALEARFDVIAIVSNNNKLTVKHLEGAFYPRLK